MSVKAFPHGHASGCQQHSVSQVLIPQLDNRWALASVTPKFTGTYVFSMLYIIITLTTTLGHHL